MLSVMRGHLRCLIMSILLGSVGCAWDTGNVAGKPWVAFARHGMVASDSIDASEAGAEILRQGGNAIDAAVATSLALAVTRPYSTGLGGGGFLMVRFADTGRVFILDYRECAPRASTPDMFVQARDRDPAAPPPSRYGGLAVAVPGLLAGHGALLARFGTFDLERLVKPAYRLADEGFAVDGHYQTAMDEIAAEYKLYPALRGATEPLRQRLLFDEQAPPVGMRLQQPELAESLKLIAEEGVDCFYRGRIGQAIAKTVRAHGGILTMNDLAHYRPVWREPIRCQYRGWEVLLMPPPSSGGICLAETLNILENWDLRAVRNQDAGLAAHFTVEALKHAFADRARHLGDADFAAVPVARLTSEAYAAGIAKRIRPDSTRPPPDYGWTLDDDAGTTHYCIADRWGNVVSATETINTSFGSLLMAEGTGIVLNNQMDDFTTEPDAVNAYGLRQSVNNGVQPFKRPLSSMSPTIVLAGDKPFLALGASGGPRIITATLQVMLNVIEYGLPVDRAIEWPRWHHQWEPDVVYRNDFPPDDPVILGLERRGHKISEERREAVVQMLQIKKGRFGGASDPRKGGQPSGFQPQE